MDKVTKERYLAQLEDMILEKAETIYRENMRLYNTDENFRKKMNVFVAKMQRGDPEVAEELRLWKILRAISIKKMNEVYGMLNVKFD